MVIAGLLAVPALAARDARGSSRLVAADGLERDVLVEINRLRTRHALVPLRLSRPLSAAADVHSRAMAQRGFFAHESPDGSAFWKRVQRFYSSARYGFWSVGENLVWSSPDLTAAQALELWLDSPSHRRNLLEPRWREVGLSAIGTTSAPGVFGGLDVTVVTADFGTRR